jgi:hypothetical protein
VRQPGAEPCVGIIILVQNEINQSNKSNKNHNNEKHEEQINYRRNNLDAGRNGGLGGGKRNQ